jgi:hypothetical protein
VAERDQHGVRVAAVAEVREAARGGVDAHDLEREEEQMADLGGGEPAAALRAEVRERADGDEDQVPGAGRVRALLRFVAADVAAD